MSVKRFEKPVIQAAKNWKATKTVVSRGAVRVYDAVGKWWEGRGDDDGERKRKEEAFRKDAQKEKDRGEDVPEREKKDDDEKKEDDKMKSVEPETTSEIASSEMDILSPPPVLVNFPGIDLNSGDNLDAGVEVNSAGVKVPCPFDEYFEESRRWCPSPLRDGASPNYVLLFAVFVIILFSRGVEAVTRPESIEPVQNILEEANRRIQPTGTLELFGALRGRLSDGNNKLVMEALSTIGGIAYAMGPAVEKPSKIPYITTALSEPKLGAEGRKDLSDWLSRQLSALNDFPDALHLLKPVSVAITDKSADVRKAAEACLGEIFKACGPEMVTKNLRDIQGPAFALVAEKLKAAVPDLYDSTQIFSTASLPKSNSRVGKAASNAPGDRAPKHGLKSVSSAEVITDQTTSYCKYDSGKATGLGVGSFIFLLASQLLIMFASRCLCCGRGLRPGGSTSMAIILFTRDTGVKMSNL